MPRARDRRQFCLCRNQFDCRFHLRDGTESVSNAMHKEGGCPKIAEMPGSHLARFLGRVQRVGEKQKAINEAGLCGHNHRRLPASIRMTPKKDVPKAVRPHRPNGRSQPILISLRTASRRGTLRPGLAKRKVAAQHRQPGGTKCFRQRPQQQGLTVRPGAVSQDQTVFSGNGRPVQEAANGRVLVGHVNEFFVAGHNSEAPGPVDAGDAQYLLQMLAGELSCLIELNG